jgi:hypothetical protein
MAQDGTGTVGHTLIRLHSHRTHHRVSLSRSRGPIGPSESDPSPLKKTERLLVLAVPFRRRIGRRGMSILGEHIPGRGRREPPADSDSGDSRPFLQPRDFFLPLHNACIHQTWSASCRVTVPVSARNGAREGRHRHRHRRGTVLAVPRTGGGK